MFLQKYKELDNLCKDLLNSERGVSSYIENMEQCAYSRKIAGWEEDYKNLKKYRYIRNRIVHENNADEATLCSKADEVWIEDFYDRILHCEDPLALHRKYTMSFHQHSQRQTSQTEQSTPKFEIENNIAEKRKGSLFVIGVFLILSLIIGLLVYYSL